ncbi:MAG TPA: tRNA uridine-5-carboxymethylaminomethyl(34) synthesis GTPase MnmE [Pyrinomonadaceae bacterium]|nr:tRNA uridine-5-carboxymethylaminomethyl(34) synthesis GTPase MnmE [Pyrinomonadaceae bacterium]
MDTIVAVATPPGRSAIGVIRLSGPGSVDVLRSLIRDQEFTPNPNHTVLKKIIVGDGGEVLDYALVSYFAAPHSFTGEDMIEISCHGSPVVLRQLLDLTQMFDARLAGPGEFTLRACRNGKIDLSKAEAIRDLINARTSSAASQATRQLSGELSSALAPCKRELVSAIVTLESALEFVEDDLPEVQLTEMRTRLSGVQARLTALLETYSTGHLLRDGIKVAIVGRPNVGKSSLFNKLLRLDRAIVTDVPGTTRDSLTESINLQGIPVSLTDTAGIRKTGDKIEAIGVERTHRAIADADLLLVVIDGSTELSSEDLVVLEQSKEAQHVVAVNKSDLGHRSEVGNEIGSESKVVHLSALTGEGLDSLAAAILEPFGRVDSEDAGFLITDSRHYDLLRRAEESVGEAVGLLNDHAGEELVLVGLHNALKFLGEITGETTTEDLLSEIFSTFCIGK